MTTIDELLKKGIVARPDLKTEMKLAADLVRNGRIRLTSSTSATTANADIYNGRCNCGNGKWCQHTIAERMARTIDQPIQPLTEAEKEQRSEARAQLHRERKAAGLSVNGENNYQRQTRKRYNSGEGARAYIRMATANGATTIPEHILIQAQTGVKQ